MCLVYQVKTSCFFSTHHLPQVAYQLKLNSQGQITWLDYQANGQVIEYDKDPGTSRFQRTMIKAVSYLPIEWMM
ncbi:hypothetical protein J596_4062 [Acinetobacter baumannii 21072]|uniref:Uncharacterized protein n=1 Tax=Acinetobacter baumannii 21072 TaxID=1310697 RepID=A0A062HRA0_ACIBA|nr:hypothetical protein J596_4062 [Acinetobacter baumannii 21072]